MPLASRFHQIRAAEAPAPPRNKYASHTVAHIEYDFSISCPIQVASKRPSTVGEVVSILGFIPGFVGKELR